jgi:anti-anti-sigma regulatory factor
VVKEGGILMASNFRISIHRNSNRLELNLAGDFDGTSACELLNILSEKCDGVDRVLVNTSRLRSIYPFGLDTFQNNLYRLKEKRICLIFTGKNAMRIAPERNQFF